MDGVQLILRNYAICPVLTWGIDEAADGIGLVKGNGDTLRQFIFGSIVGMPYCADVSIEDIGGGALRRPAVDAGGGCRHIGLGNQRVRILHHCNFKVVGQALPGLRHDAR